MSDSAAPKTACECPARMALGLAADALASAGRGMIESDSLGDIAYYGAPAALKAEAEARAAALARCPCEALRETVDSMLRCVGKNAANVDDPVAAIKITYRALVETRAERDQLRAQVEEHQRWLERDSQYAENQRLRAELARRNAPEPHGPLPFDDPDGGER